VLVGPEAVTLPVLELEDLHGYTSQETWHCFPAFYCYSVPYLAGHALACRAPPFGMAPHRVHMFVKSTCSHGHRVHSQSNPHMHQHQGLAHIYAISSGPLRPLPVALCCLNASHRHSGGWPPLLDPSQPCMHGFPAASARSKLSSTTAVAACTQIYSSHTCKAARKRRQHSLEPLARQPSLSHLPFTSQDQRCLSRSPRACQNAFPLKALLDRPRCSSKDAARQVTKPDKPTACPKLLHRQAMPLLRRRPHGRPQR